MMHGNHEKTGGGGAASPLQLDPGAVKAGGAVLAHYVDMAGRLRAMVGELPAGQSWVGRPGMPYVMRLVEVVHGVLEVIGGERASLAAVRDKWRRDVAVSRTREGVAELIEGGIAERVPRRREALPHPDPVAIRHVVSCLSAAERAHGCVGPAVLDLAGEQILIEEEPGPHTSAGVGGWYALAGGACVCGLCVEGGLAWQELEDDPVLVLVREDGWDPGQDEDPSCRITFLGGHPPPSDDVFEAEGEKAMSCILGLRGAGDLRAWARQNPDLWGNGYGDLMFDLDVAYGVTGSDPLTVEDVTRHWLAVVRRIEAAGRERRRGDLVRFPRLNVPGVRGIMGEMMSLGDWARQREMDFMGGGAGGRDRS